VPIRTFIFDCREKFTAKTVRRGSVVVVVVVTRETFFFDDGARISSGTRFAPRNVSARAGFFTPEKFKAVR